MSKKIKEEIDELIKTLEDKYDCKSLNPVYRAEDIYKHIKPLLTDKAKEMLSKPKVTQLTSLNDNGEVDYVVRYFGVTASFRSTGALKLARIVNEIADKYQVVGVLSPPFQIELITESLTRPSDIASVFYVAMPPSDAILAERHEFALQEGEIPIKYLETFDELEEAKKNGLDKLDPNIKQEKAGTIHYRFRLSHIMTRVYEKEYEKEYDNDSIVEKEANRILYLLPKGTEYLGAKLRPITGLFYEYHMKFRNDMFVTDAELKDTMNYTREVAIKQNEDGKDRVVQFNSSNALNFYDFIQTKYGDKTVTLGEAKELTKKEFGND